MAGPAPACNPPAVAPAGAEVIQIDWYRVWPITYTENPSSAYFANTVANIHNAGGTIIAVRFYDTSHKLIPTDPCGNPLPPKPPSGGGVGGGGPPACPDGFFWDAERGTCIPIPPGGIPPVVGGGGGGVGGGSGGSTTPPPPTPSCPPGFHWDAQREVCVADTIPIVPPRQTGDDDDQSGDCCAETLLALDAIRDGIAALHGTVGGGNDQNAGCCVEVVTAIKLVAEGMHALVQAFIDKSPTVNVHLDLAPLADAINSLHASFATLIDANEGDTANLVRALDGIKSAVENPDPCVCEELKKLNTGTPEAQASNRAFIDQLQEQGFIDSATAQILGG